MKFAKLSLAAIVAAGAMTTFSSAAPLEEAIKGVDLKSWVRYRVHNNDFEEPGKTSADEHRFSGSFTFTIPVADNLRSVLSLAYDTAAGDRDARKVGAKDENLAVTQAYFQYATADYALSAGKMFIATPWTYPDVFQGQFGNGLLGVYKAIDGWAFSASVFFNTNDGKNNGGGILGGSENFYVASAVGSMGPVNAQVWASKLDHIYKHSVFTELSTRVAGLRLKGQVNYMKLEQGAVAGLNHASDEKTRAVDDSGLFWGAQANYAIDAFAFGAGYTKTGKDMGVFALAANHDLIRAGKQIYEKNKTLNIRDMETMFVTANYTIGDYRLGAGYVKAEQNKRARADNKKFKLDEWYLDARYTYSKNFNLVGYYSVLEQDNKEGNNRVRVEANYRF